MNYHIARIRLASVGPEPARFDPLDLTLMNADGTGPADSVLYLPNTGGKTVLLRLLFSVLHPPVVDRIGTEETTRRSKNITSYVLEGDTAHVVIEWRLADKGKFTDAEVLLTGLVAEWRGGTPTGNPADLARVWYTVRGAVEQVGIDRLNFYTDGGNGGDAVPHRLRLRKYKERVEDLGRGRGGPVVVTTDTQREWGEHLDKLGLDHALFRYQGQMNHNEAGASAIAKFTSDLAFIDFFVKAVMDPDDLDLLDHQFEEVAEKVRRYPEYEHWLRFHKAVLAEMEPLAVAVRVAAEARTAAEAARVEGLQLLARFLGGAKIAWEREQAELRRATERDGDARRLATQAERARDEVREYRRIDATWKRDEAAVRSQEAIAVDERSALDLRAWEVSEWLVLYQKAEARVAALQVTYNAEQLRLRPKQIRRDDAAAALRDRYAANAVLADMEAETEQGRTGTLRIKADEVRKEQQAARDEARELEHSMKTHETTLQAVRKQREGLVAQGMIEATEPAAAARDRVAQRGTEAAALVARLGDELETLEVERNRLDEADRVDSGKRLAVQQEHDKIAHEVKSATADRTLLATDPLVLEVAETQPVDLDVLGAPIADRLLRQEALATNEATTLALRAADDRRAVEALKVTRLLPPTPDVEAVLHCLRAAGIDSALAGPAYLAEAFRADERYPVAAACPELAGGIVLTEPTDLPRAQAALAAAHVSPTLLITVGDMVRLYSRGETDRPGRTFLLPPAEAIWNPDAGDAERVTREARLGTYDAQRGKVVDRARRARQLADLLSQHLAAYPKGRLGALVTRQDMLAAEVRDLSQRLEDRADRRREIVSGIRTRRDAQQQQKQLVLLAERQSQALEALVVAETMTVELEPLIERERAEAAEWHHQSQDLQRDYARLQEEILQATQRSQQHRTTAERNREDAKRIRLSRAPVELRPEDAQRIVAQGKPLAELETWFERLEEELKSDIKNSVVAADLQQSITQRDALSQQIQRDPPAVRERAAALLALPEASSEAGRAVATRQAREARVRTAADRQQAYTLHEVSKRELEEIEADIRKSGHSVRLPTERMPRDRHHAALLTAEARQAAEIAQAQASAADRERDEAQATARESHHVWDSLTSYGTTLKIALGLADDAPVPAAPPYTDDLASAQVLGTTVGRKVQESFGAQVKTEEDRRQCDTQVRGVLTQFADLSGKYLLHDRLTTASLDTLARDAEPLLTEMRSTIEILGNEIATRNDDMRLAAKNLARMANKTLTLLRSAERRSRMPATLRDWAHIEFLTIRFEKPQGDELESRLVPFVSELLSRPTDRPTGSALLLQALERAIGKFSVSILKPNEAFEPIQVPIADVSSPAFSNGQRSTVATALMLMLSELRHQSRSAARGASVGTLLLDNPFGNANAGFLIEVQRTIAAAAGIQLVFTTGIKDLNALRHFPNVIALSNDAVRRSMRRFVRANPDLLQVTVPADTRPGGRVTATQVVATLERHGTV